MVIGASAYAELLKIGCRSGSVLLAEPTAAMCVQATRGVTLRGSESAGSALNEEGPCMGRSFALRAHAAIASEVRGIRRTHGITREIGREPLIGVEERKERDVNEIGTRPFFGERRPLSGGVGEQNRLGWVAETSDKSKGVSAERRTEGSRISIRGGSAFWETPLARATDPGGMDRGRAIVGSWKAPSFRSRRQKMHAESLARTHAWASSESLKMSQRGSALWMLIETFPAEILV
ncbi:hypothetical protein BC628DRAFT_1397185 [Trametes gibbosa]|nr:hypothetical protein BC628DRAFT_1397185 [Trametes gibbosa]